MKRPSTTGKGQAAEKRAAALLIALGYRILARNLRGPSGEIDLVCMDGSTLVFVEVKCRTTGTYGSALTAVDARKRRRIRAAAADYAQILAPEARIRFDIVALDGNRVAVHRNAF